MRTDRELLGLAAKALGWVDFPGDSVEAGRYWHLDAKRAPFGVRVPKDDWNPLEDDGQALRLAVALRLDLTFYNGFQEVHSDSSRSDGLTPSIRSYGDDVGAATRRAIVDAAAALGAQL